MSWTDDKKLIPYIKTLKKIKIKNKEKKEEEGYYQLSPYPNAVSKC